MYALQYINRFIGAIFCLMALISCNPAKTGTVYFKTKPITFVNSVENNTQLMSEKKSFSISVQTLLNNENATSEMIKKATVDSIILSINHAENFNNIANLSLSFYPPKNSKLKMLNVASSGKPGKNIKTYSFAGSDKKDIAEYLKCGEFSIELNVVFKEIDTSQFAIDAVLVFKMEATMPKDRK